MKFLDVMFGGVDHGMLMRLPYFGYNVGLGVFYFLGMWVLMYLMGMMGLVGNVMMIVSLLFMLLVLYGSFVLSVKRFRDMGMKHEKLMGFLFVFLGFMLGAFQMPMLMTHLPMMHDMIMNFHLHMVFQVLSFVLFLMLLFVPSGYMKK